jgi:hypothetical protein
MNKEGKKMHVQVSFPHQHSVETMDSVMDRLGCTRACVYRDKVGMTINYNLRKWLPRTEDWQTFQTQCVQELDAYGVVRVIMMSGSGDMGASACSFWAVPEWRREKGI